MKGVAFSSFIIYLDVAFRGTVSFFLNLCFVFPPPDSVHKAEW